jgi:hypothetical protein
VEKYELVYRDDDLDNRMDYGPLERITVSSSQLTGWVYVRLVPFVPLEELTDTRGYLVRIEDR